MPWSNFIKAEEADRLTFPFRPLNFAETDSVQALKESLASDIKGFELHEIQKQRLEADKAEEHEVEEKINAGVLERVKEIEEEAYQKGFELGRQEGQAAAYEALKEQLARHVTAFESFMKHLQLESHFKEKVNDARWLELLFKVAAKLIKKEVSYHPDVLINLIRQTAEELSQTEVITVRLHPDFLHILVQLKLVVDNILVGDSRVVFEADPELAFDACILDSKVGSIDLSLDSRIEAMWEQLSQALPFVNHG